MSYVGLLINTCTLVFKAYAAEFTDPTLTLVHNVQCRKMVGNKLVRNAEGELIVSYAKFFFLSTQTLDNAVAVRENGIDHPFIKVSEHQNSTVTHHKEAFVE